ncbi:hypothetical protein JVT61DRAFT_5985 [Boletus reticuloceps]|uniref:Uncharacterized protein n=1 Tax=Boletus reticuloceps TaxID=495285 RepID=A0A8I3A8F9_9AGAM|nr:hypothetical protein JVT61DRAFT_5985 [Boletus reticuloceps]
MGNVCCADRRVTLEPTTKLGGTMKACTAHQKPNPALGSTLVSDLDAYLGLRAGIPGEKFDYLDSENAWAEDPKADASDHMEHECSRRKGEVFLSVYFFMSPRGQVLDAVMSNGFSKIDTASRLRVFESITWLIT